MTARICVSCFLQTVSCFSSSSFRTCVDHLKLTVLAPSAKHFLIELAYARLRDFFDEGPALGHPPLSHTFRQKRAELLRPGAASSLQHDTSERALIPLLVGHSDDCRFDHIRVSHQRSLELYRRDPFTA